MNSKIKSAFTQHLFGNKFNIKLKLKDFFRINSKHNIPIKKCAGFTLVELIVVITILAILGTIGFISFNGYSSNARDSVRISDLTNIQKGLDLYQVKAGTYPIPDFPVTITANNTPIGYQGYLGSTVQGLIKLSGDSKDPLDNITYTYLVNSNKTKYQLLSFLENSSSLSFRTGPQVYADLSDYSKRYINTKGDQLGILLSSGTLVPIQATLTGVDIVTTTGSYTAYFSNKDSLLPGTGSILQSLQISYINGAGLGSPSSCPSGFIPVPGNQEFNQPGFCVAKYEMKASNWNPGYYSGGHITTGVDHCYNGSGCGDGDGIIEQTDFPTSWAIQSSPSGIPITYITQEAAIQACKNIGAHLITNNEWMTIARNIEANPSNWSTNTVGTGYIYSGHNDNSPAYAISASTSDSDGYNQTGNSSGNQKRTLALSNGQIIWDLSGNVWEHVNSANNIDGSNFDKMNANACGAAGTLVWNWYSFTNNATTDTSTQCNFLNGYSYSSMGPKTTGLNASNGIGRIYSFKTDSTTYTNRIFLRGASWGNTSDAGVFALRLTWSAGITAYSVGFRCAK